MSERAAPIRKWSLVKLAAGDYILPGNTGRYWFRISSYDEDGSAVRGTWPNETPVFGTFWQADYVRDDSTRMRRRSINELRDLPWRTLATSERTRQSTIDYCLQWETTQQ